MDARIKSGMTTIAYDGANPAPSLLQLLAEGEQEGEALLGLRLRQSESIAISPPRGGVFFASSAASSKASRVFSASSPIASLPTVLIICSKNTKSRSTMLSVKALRAAVQQHQHVAGGVERADLVHLGQPVEQRVHRLARARVVHPVEQLKPVGAHHGQPLDHRIGQRLAHRQASGGPSRRAAGWKGSLRSSPPPQSRPRAESQ